MSYYSPRSATSKSSATSLPRRSGRTSNKRKRSVVNHPRDAWLELYRQVNWRWSIHCFERPRTLDPAAYSCISQKWERPNQVLLWLRSLEPRTAKRYPPQTRKKSRHLEDTRRKPSLTWIHIRFTGCGKKKRSDSKVRKEKKIGFERAISPLPFKDLGRSIQPGKSNPSSNQQARGSALAFDPDELMFGD